MLIKPPSSHGMSWDLHCSTWFAEAPAGAWLCPTNCSTQGTLGRNLPICYLYKWTSICNKLYTCSFLAHAGSKFTYSFLGSESLNLQAELWAIFEHLWPPKWCLSTFKPGYAGFHPLNMNRIVKKFELHSVKLTASSIDFHRRNTPLRMKDLFCLLLPSLVLWRRYCQILKWGKQKKHDLVAE